MPGMPSKRVPNAVWEPIAERIAAEHRVTRQAMLFHGVARMFFVPRAKFWRELKGLPAGYSLSAIAAITGHHYSTLISALESANSSIAPAAINIPRKKVSNLVGKIFGTLAVIAITDQRRANQRVWRCKCAVCGTTSEMLTNGLLRGTECPTCKRTRHAHRIDQATLHATRRRNKEGLTSR